MPNAEQRRIKARLAVSTRYGNQERIDSARRDLAAANLRAYIRRVVAKAPPLTDEQIAEIRALLPLPDAAEIRALLRPGHSGDAA